MQENGFFWAPRPNPFPFWELGILLIFIADWFLLQKSLADTTKQENSRRRKPRNSEISRPIKQNVNVSRAEAANQATKY